MTYSASDFADDVFGAFMRHGLVTVPDGQDPIEPDEQASLVLAALDQLVTQNKRMTEALRLVTGAVHWRTFQRGLLEAREIIEEIDAAKTIPANNDNAEPAGWTDADQLVARTQGWIVTIAHDTPPTIARDPHMGIFTTDENAREFVRKLADDDDALARRALAFIAAHKE
jgi:hypothetical protein